jgi:hypothetical protein
MITDARAQIDLIASLHLERLFETAHVKNANDQSNRAARPKTEIPGSTENGSLPLRRRLAVIQVVPEA